MEQQRKQLPFIPRRVGALEQRIEVVAQLFGEHCQCLITRSAAQPITVEIDRALADRIGAPRSGNGAGGQHIHRRQAAELSGAPMLQQILQLRRFPRQLQRRLCGPAQAAVPGPLTEQLAPVVQQGIEERRGHEGMRELRAWKFSARRVGDSGFLRCDREGRAWDG